MPQLVSFIVYFDLAQSTQKNCLIICDRGIMDASACKFYPVLIPPAKRSFRGVYCFQHSVIPSTFKAFAL